MVACAEQKFADDHRDTLLNPVVIIEVLSESTKNYDRGEKFTHYRRIDSLREYLLVAQDCAHIELHVRQAGNGWLLTEFDGREAAIRLAAISCELAAAEIYDKIEFE
jgi:Uma2 family endonuclease